MNCPVLNSYLYMTCEKIIWTFLFLPLSEDDLHKSYLPCAKPFSEDEKFKSDLTCAKPLSQMICMLNVIWIDLH